MDFSRLTPNLSKCEIAGIGVLKRIQVAVCSMRCVDLNNDTLKILGTSFSYNEKLTEGKKLLYNCNKYSTSIENMENEKSYTRRENCYFQNISDIRNCFSIFDNNRPKAYHK